MTIKTWVRPDFTKQSTAQYKLNIEACPYGMFRFADSFRGFANPFTNNFDVYINGGDIWTGSDLTPISGQIISGLTAPATNPRIARVFIHPQTGQILALIGTEAATPVPPPTPNGYVPLFKIYTYPGQTHLVDSDFTDERIYTHNKLPTIYVIAANTSLDKSHLGNILAVTDAATITLPPLADVRIGQSIEFVSLTNKAQKIQPATGEQLEGVQSFWRLPSFLKVKITKLNSYSWYFTEKPAFFVGQVIETSTPVDEFSNVFGAGFWPTDGSTLSRTDFSNLAEVYDIGGGNYTWGNGDGATTFNLPDFRGRVTIGSGQGPGLTNRTVGSKGGAESHQLTIAQLPSYNLPIFDPGHNHSSQTIPAGFYYVGSSTLKILTGNSWYSGWTHVSAAPAGISLTVPSGGSNQPHNNMAPYMATHSYIKV